MKGYHCLKPPQTRKIVADIKKSSINKQVSLWCTLLISNLEKKTTIFNKNKKLYHDEQQQQSCKALTGFFKTLTGHMALWLIRRHERCSRKLARYTNHLTFLTRCIKYHVVPIRSTSLTVSSHKGRTQSR